MKQDLLITLETISQSSNVGDFRYLVAQTSKALKKNSPR